jgi:anti-anti-sigma factor
VQVENNSVDHVIEYKLAGRLDSQTAGHHEETLMSLLEGCSQGIAIDMSAVTHLSTAGIRILLLTSRAYQAKGLRFVLHSLPPAVAEVVRITGLADLLTLRQA